MKLKRRPEHVIAEEEEESVEQSPGMQASLSTYHFHNFLTQFNRLSQRQKLLRRLRLVDKARPISQRTPSQGLFQKNGSLSFFHDRKTRNAGGNYSITSYQEFSEELL